MFRSSAEEASISTFARLVEGSSQIPGVHIHAPGMIINVNVTDPKISEQSAIGGPLTDMSLDLDAFPDFVLAEIGK